MLAPSGSDSSSEEQKGREKGQRDALVCASSTWDGGQLMVRLQHNAVARTKEEMASQPTY
jgi:hypothetical protein